MKYCRRFLYSISRRRPVNHGITGYIIEREVRNAWCILSSYVRSEDFYEKILKENDPVEFYLCGVIFVDLGYLGISRLSEETRY